MQIIEEVPYMPISTSQFGSILLLNLENHTCDYLWTGTLPELTIRLKINERSWLIFQLKTSIFLKILASSWRKTKNTYSLCP